MDPTYLAEQNGAIVVLWLNLQQDQMPTGTTLIFVHILTIPQTEMSPINYPKLLIYTAESGNLVIEW